MKISKSQRGINKIKPKSMTAIRHKTRPVRIAPKPPLEKPRDLMPSKVAQSSLVVKPAFLSALRSMRNADLIVKLVERFSKVKKSIENNKKIA